MRPTAHFLSLRASVASSALLFVYSACAESLRPDLRVEVVCTQRYASQVEDPALAFAQASGLDALNRGRLKREHFTSDYYGANVIALSRDGTVLVELQETNFESDQYTYSMSLFTRPPTSRMTQLEQQIERLADDLAKLPGCHRAETMRGENTAESTMMFEKLLVIYRAWFDQAKSF